MILEGGITIRFVCEHLKKISTENPYYSFTMIQISPNFLDPAPAPNSLPDHSCYGTFAGF